MSLLLIELTDEVALVFTDTLIADVEGCPLAFGMKVYPQPHVGALIGFTGSANFATGFAVSTWPTTCEDFDAWVADLPDWLTWLWDQFGGQEALSSTVTMYVLGWSPAERRCVGWAFESPRESNDGGVFVPRRLSNGLIVKPRMADMSGVACPETAVEWIALAEACRAESEDKHRQAPSVWNVRIGGDLMLSTVGAGGAVAMERVHRFDGYERLSRSVLGYHDGAGTLLVT